MLTLTTNQLDEKLRFIDSYVNAANAATGSKYDQNANVTHKNVATLAAEMHKDINIQVNRKLMVDKITEMFDANLAQEYIRQIESHEIYVHDETSGVGYPYCASVSLYPLLTNGLIPLGGESRAPKNLESFCGIFINAIFAIAAQFAGAVATVEFLMYFDYFAKKSYGEDYLNTNRERIESHLQHVVYSLNQPAAARSYQSIFWNISIYDEEYFNSLFGEFFFPDGEQPQYESLARLQEFFMSWFNTERTKAVLTFPVVTAAMLTDRSHVKDRAFAEMCATQLAEGNSFFIYQSDSADSLASCCFDGGQKILVKDSSSGVRSMAIRDYEEMAWKFKRNARVFHDGSWVPFKMVKTDRANRDMYEVILESGKRLVMTQDHLNPSLRGDVPAESLTEEDYLQVSAWPANKVSENDEGLTYADGLLIGAYLGDGTLTFTEKGTGYLTLSMNSEKIEMLKPILTGFKTREPKFNAVQVTSCDQELIKKLQAWTTPGVAYEKRLNLDCILQSIEFRKGILAGLYITDGGNSNRIYTTSPGLAEDLEILLTSLGKHSRIDVSDRTDEPVVIRGVSYSRNHPLYCVRFYEDTNKRQMKGVYKRRNGGLYFKVRSVKKLVDYSEPLVYCLECSEEEPYFTLPNGVITHNCRLRNEIADNSFSYSLGAGGVSTGSVKVITLNINRITQLGLNLGEIISKVQKYLFVYKTMMVEMQQKGLLPVYDAGFISFDKQFITIGLNGVVEAAEFLKLETHSSNLAYTDWLKDLLKTFKDANAKFKEETGSMVNTEFVPAESLGVKFAKWDKEDGLWVPRDCYNSYFYAVEDDSQSVLSKMSLYRKDIVENLDGGSALHINLETYLSKEGYLSLLDIAARVGCNYFCTNVLVTLCDDCGYIDKRTLHICSKCKGERVGHATRIIGYLKRIDSFSEARKIEAGKRKYHKV